MIKLFASKHSSDSAIFAISSLAIISTITLITSFGSNLFFNGTDIGAWANDSNNFFNCMQGDCKLTKFPLAYLLNSTILNQILMVSDFKVPGVMTIINSSVLWLNSLAIWEAYRNYDPRNRTLKLLSALAALIVSPIFVFYLRSGALELQSGLWLATGLTALVLQKYGDNSKKINLKYDCVLIFLPFLIFSLYKDTNGIYLLIAILISAFGVKNKKFTIKKPNSIVTLACAIGTGINAAYNYFRWDSILPIPYLVEKQANQQSWKTTLEFFYANIFSPKGGLLSFWGLSIATILIIAFIKKLQPTAYSLKISMAIIGIFIVSSALWWSPFGWSAWGNRLVMPGVIGGLAALIAGLKKSNYSKNTSRNFIVICVIMILSIYSIPYLTYPFKHGRAKAWYNFLDGSDECQTMIKKLQEEGDGSGELWKSKIYLNCAKARLWKRP